MGIVIPVIAVVILENEGGLLPASLSFEWRPIVLGLLIAAYPLAQFVGSPLLGAISDHAGRRKVLITVLLGSCVGYCLFALGLLWHSLPLLFASRIIDGFGGGSVAVAISAIADISREEEKARNFGLIGTAFGLGFIFGPYIGGRLSDPTTLSWFTYATPFWLAAMLCAINALLVIFWLPETLRTSINTKISMLTGVLNIRKAWNMPNIRTMFVVSFVLAFGFNFFTQFFQVFLIEKFHFSQKQIGDLFAYIGLWIVLTQGVILRPISRWFSPTGILSVSVFCLAAALPLLVIPGHPGGLYFILPLIAIFQGLIQPTSIAVVSNLATKDSQGEVMGIYQSIQSLGIAIPPIIAGFFVTVHRNMPTLVAAVCTLVAWVIFIVYFRREHRELFREV